MRVLAITAADTACEIYRIYMPFDELRRNGVEARWITTKRMASLVKQGIDAYRGWDILVLPRMIYNKSMRDIITFMQSTNVRVVYEIDDDLTGRHRPVGGDIFPLVKMCDAMTVTSHRLQGIMDVNIPTYVLPNHIDLRLCHWDHNPNGVLITGSPTHDDDWVQIVQAVRRLRAEKIKVACMGSYPQYLKGMGIEHIPFQPYEKYLQIMSTFKVVLCPLSDDPFNLGKSDIKCVEAMASGAIPVVSNHPVYNHLKGNAIVADDWYTSIRTALDASTKRRKKNLRWVARNRDIRKGWKLWYSAYRKIMEGHR